MASSLPLLMTSLTNLRGRTSFDNAAALQFANSSPTSPKLESNLKQGDRSWLGRICPAWMFLARRTLYQLPKVDVNHEHDGKSQPDIVEPSSSLWFNNDLSILTYLFPDQSTTSIETLDETPPVGLIESDSNTGLGPTPNVGRLPHVHSSQSSIGSGTESIGNDTVLTTHFVAVIYQKELPVVEEMSMGKKLLYAIPAKAKSKPYQHPGSSAATIKCEYKYSSVEDLESFTVDGCLETVLSDSMRFHENGDQMYPEEKFFGSLVHIMRALNCQLLWNGFTMKFRQETSARFLLKRYYMEPLKLVFSIKDIKDLHVTRSIAWIRLFGVTDKGVSKSLTIRGSNANEIRATIPQNGTLILDFPIYAAVCLSSERIVL